MHLMRLGHADMPSDVMLGVLQDVTLSPSCAAPTHRSTRVKELRGADVHNTFGWWGRALL